MASPEPTIDDLRREIDAIDDAMHDLLMRRAAKVETIGALARRANEARSALRPAREATILRRLVRRHGGTFPAQALVRIWRELLAGTTRMQGAFAVAVHAPEKSVGYWDLARDHYGSGTHMTLHRSARRVVREVAGGRAAIGVVALPADGETDPWWPLLMGSESNVPRIVARLPFVDNDAGRFEDLGALAIARVAHEPTGDDVTLFALETDTEMSRARLREALTKAGLMGNDVAAWADRADEATRLHLIEVTGFVAADDARFADVEATAGKSVHRAIGLGGYAIPMGKPRRRGS